MAREKRVVKRVVKVFLAWQEREEEKWLEQMARSGWSLIKASWISYTFERGEPQEVVYRIDYKELSEPQAEEYRQICEDLGWEFVGRSLNWFYFRRPLESGVPSDLYSDNTSRLERFRAQLRTMLIAFFPYFVTALFLVPTALRRFDGWWVYAVEIVLLAGSLFLFYCIGRVWAIVRKLESELKE